MWYFIIIIILLLYIFFDVNYFLRFFLVIIWNRVFKPKSKLNEIVTNYGICFTNDLDYVFSHMNNARYLRDLDFARLTFYLQTNFIANLRGKNVQGFQTATYIRYRRSIPIFAPYKITTKLIHWNERSTYLEHRFVTLNDNFVRAIVLSEQKVIGVDLNNYIPNMLDGISLDAKPAEFDDWLKSLEKSSERLKKES